MRPIVARIWIVFVSVAAAINASGTEPTPDKPKEGLTEAEFERQRVETLAKLRKEEQERENTPEAKQRRDEEKREHDRKRSEETERLFASFSASEFWVRARVVNVTVEHEKYGSILAYVRFAVQKSKRTGDKKPQLVWGDEKEEPFWIEGVDTRALVDNDLVTLRANFVGKKSYRAVSGTTKTVRRLAASLVMAVYLTQEGK